MPPLAASVNQAILLCILGHPSCAIRLNTASAVAPNREVHAKLPHKATILQNLVKEQGICQPLLSDCVRLGDGPLVQEGDAKHNPTAICLLCLLQSNIPSLLQPALSTPGDSPTTGAVGTD